MNWKIFAICVVGLLNCAFQQSPRPADSGRIQGTVCELDGCSPIKGARVTIEPTNSVGLKRIVTTDDAGGFQFSELPAGRYVLEAEAKDFIAVAALPLIAIGDGGRAEDVKVFMRPFGSISGQVVDENNKPVAFAPVAATSFPPRISATATADDHGKFRVAGLASGEYILRIAPPAARRACGITVRFLSWNNQWRRCREDLHWAGYTHRRNCAQVFLAWCQDNWTVCW